MGVAKTHRNFNNKLRKNNVLAMTLVNNSMLPNDAINNSKAKLRTFATHLAKPNVSAVPLKANSTKPMNALLNSRLPIHH